MEILKVKTIKGLVLEPGDKIKIKVIPLVDDEEDKENPIIKDITIHFFRPNEDGSLIQIVGTDAEYYYEDEILGKIPQ